MKLHQAVSLGTLMAQVAGTQATSPDSRQADEWIKTWQDRREASLNEMRQKLSRVFDREPETHGVDAARNTMKPTPGEQWPGKVAPGGRFAVTDPDDLIISAWPTEEEARHAASAQRYTRVVDMGAEDEYRDRFLGDKPEDVEKADGLRSGLGKYRGTGGGAAGTGGTGSGG